MARIAPSDAPKGRNRNCTSQRLRTVDRTSIALGTLRRGNNKDIPVAGTTNCIVDQRTPVIRIKRYTNDHPRLRVGRPACNAVDRRRNTTRAVRVTTVKHPARLQPCSRSHLTDLSVAALITRQNCFSHTRITLSMTSIRVTHNWVGPSETSIPSRRVP